MFVIWSQRVLIISTGAWLLLGTVYFARPSHPLLPSPLNVFLFIALASVSTGSLATWFASKILGHLNGQSAVLDRMAEALEVRDGRLYFELARTRGEVARLRELVEQTTDLTRPLALVGSASAYDEGFADGLARQPMREAKVIQMGPRESG